MARISLWPDHKQGCRCGDCNQSWEPFPSSHWAVVQAEREQEADLPGCLPLLAVAIVLAVLGVAGLCSAQDAPIPTRGSEGAPGMWLPLEDFRTALSDREAIPRYVEQIRLLSESLSLAHAEISQRVAAQTATDLNVEQLGQSIEGLITQVSVANARATAAESERDAWYRSPFLWAAIGLIVGVVGVCLVVVGITT